MLREGLIVTVALLAAAASVTPAVAALQLASDGNVDATLKLEKDTALHLLLFGEPAAKKKISKKKPKCNFPLVHTLGGCWIPCYFKHVPDQAYCYRPKAAGRTTCPPGRRALDDALCSNLNSNCSGGDSSWKKVGCIKQCREIKAWSMETMCSIDPFDVTCPTNYEKDKILPFRCVTKGCLEGYFPSAKDGSCVKECPKGLKPKNGKCAYICANGYKSTAEGGCRA